MKTRTRPITFMVQKDTFRIPSKQADDPETYLRSAEGYRLVRCLASDLYYTRFERGNYCLSLKQATKLADLMIDGHATEEGAEGALYEHFEENHYGARQAMSDQGGGWIERAVEELADRCSDRGIDFDAFTWTEALEEAVAQSLEDSDRSTPFDCLSTSDRAEVAFIIGEAGANTLYTRAQSCSIADLERTDALFDVLKTLGFRKTDLDHDPALRSDEPREPSHILAAAARAKDLKNPVGPRMVTAENLRAIIENGATYSFQMVAYAIVTLPELAAIDLSLPITLSRAEIGIWDRWNGSYFGMEAEGPLTFQPTQGNLVACTGYSPDECCGFVESFHHADLSNPPEDAGGTGDAGFPQEIAA